MTIDRSGGEKGQEKMNASAKSIRLAPIAEKLPEDPDMVPQDFDPGPQPAGSDDHRHILVIKLSAFGDFVLSIRSFQAIRAHHPKADITLLTTAPYAALARASSCFNSVWIDTRPRIYDIPALFKLRKNLHSGHFSRVYDLQRNDRSHLYYRLFPLKKPEWVGTIKGCSHYYKKPENGVYHIAVREKNQLEVAGIKNIHLPDLSFITAEIEELHLPRAYAMLVPGGAAHRPQKRWPAENYAELAHHLTHLGITPVIIGGTSEQAECDTIKDLCPAARNLCGATSLEQIAVIARKSQFAIGNDTGPMHLISAASCPTVVLFSAASDPNKISPIGPDVQIIQTDNLQDLTLEEVTAALPAAQLD
ncbi:glycosyltransferase family 9 protein [Kiloniella laminariae]|uniref:Glycosyltransferase family 9 protein n=1 Tax=Kiloniella laminariae TaxID=454162 RepID=A0ABT4LEN7_9PROT|nr:glycosyltransferase family 9 protein [Kiloniella laminariae]MCZ4279563.1 glycosyltransferase family 9 protein [Kiloniella laminariae]